MTSVENFWLATKGFLKDTSRNGTENFHSDNVILNFRYFVPLENNFGTECI